VVNWYITDWLSYQTGCWFKLKIELSQATAKEIRSY